MIYKYIYIYMYTVYSIQIYIYIYICTIMINDRRKSVLAVGCGAGNERKMSSAGKRDGM